MSQVTICLLIFAGMVITFFLNKIPMACVAMASVVLVVLTKCIEPAKALSLFGSSTVITMASMYIVAAGLRRTQMINNISKILYNITGGSFTKVLASYAVATCVIGQFIPSTVVIFLLVQPLVQNMCDRMKISPSKMMFPIAIACVSTSYIIQPIGPYAALYLQDNGVMESYGWTATKFELWSETGVLLPVGIITLLLAIFIVPRFLPNQPETQITSLAGRTLEKKEPLSPVREVIGYGVFIAVVACLMLGVTAWIAALAGAALLVITGVLTEKEAIESLNISTVLLYVGVTIMGNALAATGAANLLAELCAKLLSGVKNGYVLGFAFYVISFIMTSFLYNRAVTTVAFPLVVITCSAIGADPRGPVMMCALASMSSLITPMSTAIVPMVMNAGGYSTKTILRVGLIPAAARGVVGTIIAMTIFPAF